MRIPNNSCLLVVSIPRVVSFVPVEEARYSTIVFGMCLLLYYKSASIEEDASNHTESCTDGHLNALLCTAPSAVHGTGVFAKLPIAPGTRFDYRG